MSAGHLQGQIEVIISEVPPYIKPEIGHPLVTSGSLHNMKTSFGQIRAITNNPYPTGQGQSHPIS